MTSHGLIAMWNIFGFFVVIRGLPTFFLIFFLKKRCRDGFAKEDFFSFLYILIKPSSFFLILIFFAVVNYFFVMPKIYQSDDLR